MEKYLINPNQKISHIHKDIYGHFSEHLGRCIYEGLYVGEDSDIPNVNGMRTDVVMALREMGLPVLRWPGGCFADEYHWKDGVGPKQQRKKILNTHWGKVVEDNSFGTHEYFELCRQLGCDTYINGNVGSGTVQEMNEWVEYMTFDGTSPMAELRKANGHEKPWTVQYFGVGNENWGCGGNMDPEYYGCLFKRYETYIRNYGDQRIYRIACGPNAEDYHWTDRVMDKVKYRTNGLSLHYYTDIWDSVTRSKKAATGFSAEDYTKTLAQAYRIDDIVTRHIEIMNRHDRDKRVDLIVDEWGTWYEVEPGTNPGFLYQQNTMRDAMVAALTLNIFNEHCDILGMANVAQLCNNLHSLFLAGGDGFTVTPNYHVFDMYKEHQGGRQLHTEVQAETLEREGLQCDFYIIGSHVSPEYSIKTELSYDEVVRLVQKSDYIIDYYTDPLAGLSLRPLEAMFFEKKLITNNVTIRNYDFYSDHNIFICQDGFDGIRDFIAKPYQSVNKKIRERYLFSFWRSSF